jgi:GNAT superfamily N-acetyltransferase
VGSVYEGRLVMEVRGIRYMEILGAQNADALLTEYAGECSIPEIGAASPQAEMYAAMEGSGMFQAFGVFQEAELVGFAAVLVYVLPHYGRQIATVESLFVAKAHRCGNAGLQLMRAIEQHAKLQECVAILYSAPTGSQLEKLLSLLKPYRNTNSVFCRSLQ